MPDKLIIANAALLAAAAVAAILCGLPAADAQSPQGRRPSRPVALAPVVDQRLPVQAPSGPEATVRFGDLDLSSQEGAQTMVVRIRHVAGQICGGATAPGQGEDCVRETTDRAVADLASPEVAAANAAAVSYADADAGARG
jgi:UrcA family protein